MENYKSELTSLKEELNSRIDAVIAKIEKPKFEVGKWYNNESSTFLFCYQGETSYGFGNADNYEIDLETASLSPRFYHLATPKEVEEALTKEAVKRLLVNSKYIPVNSRDKEVVKVGDRFNYDSHENKLLISGWACFLNGTWATPIKTKTIEKIARELRGLLDNEKVEYLTENKQTIIETLNNL